MAATISKKGWIVIPAELRKKYHLTPGRKVQIVDYGGVIALIPSLEDPIGQSAGMLAPKDKNKERSLIDVLLEEHRQELSGE
jgi:AbrB family looped-hinge helix DNA binding protein